MNSARVLASNLTFNNKINSCINQVPGSHYYTVWGTNDGKKRKRRKHVEDAGWVCSRKQILSCSEVSDKIHATRDQGFNLAQGDRANEANFVCNGT